MRNLAGLITVVSVIGLPAQAADLAFKAPPREAAFVAPFTWQGLYTGFHLGHGWGQRTLQESSEFGDSALTEPRGFYFGSTMGYNWQFGRLVFGAEADFSHGRIENSVNLGEIDDVGLAGTARIDWFGTVRGRLGLAHDRFLVYATGGFAWAHVNSTIDFNVGAGNVRLYDDRLHTGWTAGGGIEYAFAPGWSAKAEYLYMDLGTQGYTHFSPDLPLDIAMTMHTVKVGLNRQFPVSDLPHRALMRDRAEDFPFTWAGLYLGGHVGYGWGSRASEGAGGLPLPEPQGAFYGSTIGYNWQSGQMVLGAEADFSFGRLEDSVIWESGGGDSIGATAHMDYFGTVRGRVGFASNRFLAYATAGLAWGHVHSTIDLRSDPVALRIYDHQTHVGWTAGGGVEYAFARNWTVKAEYLYLDLGTRDYAYFSSEAPVAVSMTAHTGRLGLNYKFDPRAR